jgi:glycosyltransferase involved in cell wall biosynthesis
MNRILYISGYQIFPPLTGGHIRAANVIQALASSGCEVRVYSLSGRAAGYASKLGSTAETVAPSVEEYVNRRLALGALQSLSGRLAVPAFWESLVMRFMPLPAALRERIAWCDAVMINHCYLFPIFSRLGAGKTRLINSHNLEQKMWQEHWWQRRIVTPIVRFLEGRSGKRADAILCCAEDERRFFARNAAGDTRLYAVPNGIFPERYLRNEQVRAEVRRQLGLGEGDRCILFVGSRYAPNRDALSFLQAFAARHQALMAELKLTFLVVGNVAASPSRAPGIICTGFVDEVLPYFHAADLAINPITQGSGTNVKVFEYLASSLPLLSTAFGVRGFELDHGADYLAFTRDDLAGVLADKLAKMTPLELCAMAARAADKNRDVIDMNAIIAGVVASMKGPKACE